MDPTTTSTHVHERPAPAGPQAQRDATQRRGGATRRQFQTAPSKSRARSRPRQPQAGPPRRRRPGSWLARACTPKSRRRLVPKRCVRPRQAAPCLARPLLGTVRTRRRRAPAISAASPWVGRTRWEVAHASGRAPPGSMRPRPAPAAGGSLVGFGARTPIPWHAPAGGPRARDRPVDLAAHGSMTIPRCRMAPVCVRAFVRPCTAPCQCTHPIDRPRLPARPPQLVSVHARSDATDGGAGGDVLQ